MMMTTRQANAIAAAVARILERHQSEEPALQGVDIVPAGGSIGESFTMKLICAPQLTAEQEADMVKAVDIGSLHAGFAQAGTPVECNGRGGVVLRGVIVKAARSRYHVRGRGGKYDGQIFTIPFRAVRLPK